jgi:hypothetical protein
MEWTRLILVCRLFFLLFLLQWDTFFQSNRRYLFSLHWCWTIIFFLGGIDDGNKVTAIVNNKEEMKGGRMNFIRDGIKLPIPSDGVYFGISIYICLLYFFFFIHFFIIFFPKPLLSFPPILLPSPHLSFSSLGGICFWRWFW